jgi:two-component system phosphate regulon response regulator PhoB
MASGQVLARELFMDRRRLARPQRILVVDDSADMRDLWNVWLTAHGFSVLEAENGLEALQQVDERPPDLVLLDVMMPVMDGLETLKRLRAVASTSAVPVIMLSAQDETGAWRARQLGPDLYLRKPVAPDDLMRHIRGLLRRG